MSSGPNDGGPDMVEDRALSSPKHLATSWHVPLELRQRVVLPAESLLLPQLAILLDICALFEAEVVCSLVEDTRRRESLPRKIPTLKWDLADWEI